MAHSYQQKSIAVGLRAASNLRSNNPTCTRTMAKNPRLPHCLLKLRCQDTGEDVEPAPGPGRDHKVYRLVGVGGCIDLNRYGK